MIETTNIKLKKYEDGDDPDLTAQYNQSMDILDQKVKANADAASAAKELVTSYAAPKEEVAWNHAEHNATYPGRAIREIYPEKFASGHSEYKILHDLVAARDWSKIRNGDYITVPLTAGDNVPAQNVIYEINGIDHYYNCADQAIPHHLVMTPRASITVSGSKAVNTSYIQWNLTNDNNGTAEQPHPYLASHLHDWEINDFMPALPAELRGFIVPNRILLEKRYSADGKLTESTDWAWQSVPIWSMSEMELYGCPVWGTKGYSVGFDSQLPLFKNTAARIKGGRVGFWLRSVYGGSSTYVCNCGGTGPASSHAATGDGVRPRPCFLLG